MAERPQTEEIRRAYDRLGAGLEAMEHFERVAKQRALTLLAVQSGEHVLNVGVGTGAEHAQLVQAVGQSGIVCGVDLSPVMLQLTGEGVPSPLVNGDTRRLPFADATFDAILCAYVFDLLPHDDFAVVLAEFRRVLRPGGRIVLVSLTEGVNAASRAFVALWRLVYTIAPLALGGCRPVSLAEAVARAGFVVSRREIVVQRGFPSEIVLFHRKDAKASF